MNTHQAVMAFVLCLASACSDGAVTLACSTTADCASPDVCFRARLTCGRPLSVGDFCADDGECATGICNQASLVCDQRQPAGAACVRSSECSSDTDCVLDSVEGLGTCMAGASLGQTCLEGRPHACVTGARCGAGVDGVDRCVLDDALSVCRATSDCPAETVCRAAHSGGPTTCLRPAASEEFCSESRDCMAGLTCDVPEVGLARCAVPQGAPCDLSAECQAGRECIGGVCEPLKALGESCSADAQCRVAGVATVCQGAALGLGVCTVALASPCVTGTPCPEGATCRPDRDGVRRCIAPGQAFASCAVENSQTCVASYVCATTTVNGGPNVCTKTAGLACTTDSECQVGLTCRPPLADALQSLCLEPGALGQGCLVAADCAAPWICGQSHTCLVADGDHCETDSDCLTGRSCVQEGPSTRLCRGPGLLGDACQHTEHCAPAADLDCDLTTQTCKRIASAYCDADHDCFASSVCFQKECVTLKPPDEACDANVVCASELCGPKGLCLAAPLGPNEPCAEGADCASGVCSNHTCL